MRKVLFYLCFVLAVATTVIGCSNEIQKPDDIKGSGKVDPVLFGELHNEYLLEAINYSSKNKSSTSKESLMTVDIPNLTSEEQAMVIDHFSQLSSDEMKDETFKYLKSKKAKDYYNEIDAALENALDYSELSDNLDSISEKVNLYLVDTDWDIVMVYLETIRSSAYFWFPSEKGGAGIGYKYGKTSLNHASRSVPSWVKADGRGAGYGMVAWSFSAFFGPVAPAGLLYGAISGAVFSSLDAIK